MSSNASQLAGSQRTLNAVGIVPARLDSSRLPRKMLLRESGQYLFEHTVRNLQAGHALQRVVLATDSEEIRQAAEGVGIEALMTSIDHKSGTDRVQEAYTKLQIEGPETYDVVVNVQGDEPDVSAGDLNTLISAFQDPEVEFATLWTHFSDPADAANHNTVKVVLDERGDALYFSRSPIPNSIHQRGADTNGSDAQCYKRHIGVYAFRPDALTRFCALPPGQLERLESLEQLRWLEAGGRLRVLQAEHQPRGIDTAEDYLAFVNRQILS
ncbi:MAG: 3-deoxy-manno-octulosonate cytidylyltransferase (CMP-KDO synthetase) [Planctomycetota bacterium]|jgi:3-deoxy-manno-octulosonate cytidylyltransferase (CMP-KDO synthetase)